VIACEGYRRYGGAFTLGPVRWEQCDSPAEVSITVQQGSVTKTFPCCTVCWQEAINNTMTILNCVPLGADHE
jgi:hypothetical protein